MRKENGPLQAPVSREAFQAWANLDQYTYSDLLIRQTNGEVLGFHRYDILPEVDILFAGDPERMCETMEPCGLYDKRTQEFRFVNRTMAACATGLSESELWDRGKQGPNMMQLIKNYGKHAVEQGGYQLKALDMEYYGQKRTVFAGLNAATSYAGVLAARGEESTLLDLRDLAFDMHPYWQDSLYQEYQKAGVKQEQQYKEKFDSAVELARVSGQPPKFDGQKASAILKALDIHAQEELYGNENHFAVWQCCRLAKRLQKEFPRLKTDFGVNFPADHSERFVKFGCGDSEHLCDGCLFDQMILLFRDPIPENAVPEGWYCYHLAGRNLMKADKLLASVPESGYVGTVLTPYRLMDGEQKDIPTNELICGVTHREPLTDFCQRHRLPVPDMSGIFPDQKQTTGMEGMSL